jgi:hypothetical protein
MEIRSSQPDLIKRNRKMTTQKIGDLAQQAISLAMQSGLTWDEAIAAFGLASKALSFAAANNGNDPLEVCIAHAKKRFEQGLNQDARMVEVSSFH